MWLHARTWLTTTNITASINQTPDDLQGRFIFFFIAPFVSEINTLSHFIITNSLPQWEACASQLSRTNTARVGMGVVSAYHTLIHEQCIRLLWKVLLKVTNPTGCIITGQEAARFSEGALTTYKTWGSPHWTFSGFLTISVAEDGSRGRFFRKDVNGLVLRRAQKHLIQRNLFGAKWSLYSPCSGPKAQFKKTMSSS